MMKVAILGHGTVGSGVAEVLTSHAESIARRAKEEIEIQYILDIRDFPDSPLHDRFTKDFNQILQDPEEFFLDFVSKGHGLRAHDLGDRFRAILQLPQDLLTDRV